MMALAQQLQSQGRGSDTILAHINPAEAAMLEAAGGAGTLNPETGLPEYGWLGDLWNGVKKVWNNTVKPLVKKLAPVIIPAVSIFFPAAIPAIGAFLGATGTAATVVGTAALSAGVTLASGGTLEQAIKGAALGAAASYITPILGAKGNQLLGNVLSPTAQSYLGSALVSGGIAAARGGNVREVFKAAATGAATAYLGTLAKNYYQTINDKMTAGKLNINQKNADGSLVVAADAETYKKAGLSETQIAAALKAQGVNDAHANLAAKSIVANNSAEQTANILAEFTSKNGAAVMNSQLGKDAIAESVTLGNNQDILLRAEDSKLLAQDAVALKNQGLTEKNIQLHLEATGASRKFAIEAAAGAMRGQSADVISNNLLTKANYAASAKREDYSLGKVYDNTDFVVSREVGQVMTAEQQQDLAAARPYRDLVSAGTITMDQAATYADAGYNPADVTKLISVGYNATDLQDLAAVGVNAGDLVTLSNTKFAEGQINDLMAGGASVTDIATTSRVIDTGQIDVGTASQLLTRDVTGSAISDLANRGQAQAAANSTLTGSTINQLASEGFDINQAVALQNSGTNINQLVSENKWNDYKLMIQAPAGTVPVKDAAGNVSYFEASTGNTLDASGRVITYARAPEVGQGTQTAGPGGFDVEVSGIVGRVGNESSVRGPLSEGATLATQEDIDSGRAVVNEAANAWEVPNQYTYTTPPGEFVGPIAPPPSSTVPPWMPEGSAKYGEQNGTPIFVTPNGELYTGTGDFLGNTTPPGQTMGPAQPPTTTPVEPPTQITPTPLPPATPPVTPPSDYTYTTPPGEVVGPPAPPATQPPLLPLEPVEITPRPVTPVVVEPPLTPLQPTPVNPPAPVTPVVVEPPVTPPAGPAPVEVITPPTPYVPVPTPPVGEEPPKWSGWGPVDPLKFGQVGQINNPGLNPGWIQPTPFYNTTSPVQSQYYWGQHPYQPGPTFNQALYNTVPAAPATPFGLQQMYTPTDLNQYLSQFTPGPVAPR